MKRLIVALIVVCLGASIGYSAGELTMPTRGTHPIQAFTPKTFSVYSGTINTVSAANKLGIVFRVTAAGKYGNDSGAKYPHSADTDITYIFPSSGLTYARISTATKSYKYVQGM